MKRAKKIAIAIAIAAMTVLGVVGATSGPAHADRIVCC